jgi:hypothetical protein
MASLASKPDRIKNMFNQTTLGDKKSLTLNLYFRGI